VAISLLTSGNSTAQTGNSFNVPVTVSAGNGNRKLLIGVVTETATATITSITFNGQELVGLGLQVPGSEAAPDSGAARCVFFEQFEGGMPTPGSHNISCVFGGAGDKVVFFWLVDGARQDQLATGAQNSLNNTGSTVATLSQTIAAADAGAFLASVGYRNDNATSLQLTAPASSTMVADLTISGGGRAAGGSKLGGLTAGNNTVTWTTQATAQQRRALSAVVVNPAPEDTTLEVDTAAFTAGSATMAASATIVQDFETIELIGSPDQGLTNPRNLTVPEDADLVLVTIYGDFLSPRTGTLGGQALSVGYNDDTLGDDNSQWVQFLYMLEPPTGTQQLSLTGEGGGDHNFFVTYWRGVGSFDSAAIANAANISRTSTANGALLIAGIQDGNAAASSPATGNTELLDDSNGSHFYYRVEPVAGTYTVGASAVGGDPDLVSVIFNPKAAAGGADAEIDAAAFTAGSATMAATAQVQRQVSAAAFAAGAPTVAAEGQVQRQVSAAAFAAGAATVATSATRVREATAAFAAGAAALAAEGQVQRQVSAAAFVSGAATFFARAGQGVKPIGVAAFSATSATMAVTAVVHVHHEASAAFAASAATMAASAARARSAVAAFAAGAATVAAEGTVVRHLTATFSASSATMAVTVFNPNIVIPRPVTGSASVSVPFGYVRTRHPSGSASVSQPRGRVK
jgi:hypothetical protein